MSYHTCLIFAMGSIKQLLNITINSYGIVTVNDIMCIVEFIGGSAAVVLKLLILSPNRVLTMLRKALSYRNPPLLFFMLVLFQVHSKFSYSSSSFYIF